MNFNKPMLAAVFMFSFAACATTESTTETFVNTTEASTGFTSSTSPDRDSKSHDVDTPDEEVDKTAAIDFAEANMAKLRTDAMAGQGEYIDSVGLLLGVKKSRLPEYGTMVRENFDKIFGSSDQSAASLVANLDDAISDTPKLRKF
ncbi:MAG: DUF3015 family protein [Bdellovibrionales bacterium]|nr:DUF3015 family protein [Bdellovibrionales bacterium]